MTAPTAATLLDAWERGLARPAAERPLVLLAAAGGDEAELARLPVGRRDGRLLELRAALFGPRLEAAVDCPGCGATLELALAADDLRDGREGTDGEPVVETGGYRVRVRLPDSRDLAAAAGGGDAAAARRRLFERCVVAARRDGAAVASAELPEAVVTAVSEALERRDPGAGTAVELTCPECGHRWSSPVDVAAFLWAETDRWARRTLGEVHTLARAYGWSEGAILALGARRRRAYLELIGA